MSRTRRILYAATTLAVLLVTLGGCGLERSDVDDTAAATRDSGIPEHLVAVLGRDRIVLQDGSFSDGGVPGEEAIAAFAREYSLSSYETEPAVYAAVVVSSDEAVLEDGLPVRVVHVPGVEIAGSPPRMPNGDAARFDPQLVDMFSFFDGVSGDFLCTVYIGEA